MSNTIIFLIFQLLFLVGQIFIGHYKNEHEDEMNDDQKQFANIGYFFCAAMVFVMMICAFVF